MLTFAYNLTGCTKSPQMQVVSPAYKHLIVIYLCLLLPYLLPAQDGGQTIRGKVVDRNQNPVPNVTIELLNFYPLKTTSTDVNGEFVLKNVPEGKHKLLFRKKGYQEETLRGVRVTNKGTAEVLQTMNKLFVKRKDNNLTPSQILKQEMLRKRGEIKEEVTFEASNNEMVISDFHAASPQTFYMGLGNRRDPIRYLSNYAGISPLSDKHADLVMRGNAPNTTQWRLEGLPIQAPMHLRDFHSGSRGSQSIFSLNALGQSQALLNDLPAEYGNALQGVVDINLRRTKTPRRISFHAEYSTATGIGLSIEGPLTREKYGSFVINYRHSIFNGIQFGIEQLLDRPLKTAHPQAAPNLQDISFRLDLPGPKSDQVSFFGLVSISHENSFGGDASLVPQNPRLQSNIDERFRTNYFFGGVKYKKTWGGEAKNYWQTTLGGSFFSVNNISEYVSANEKRPEYSYEDWRYSIKLNSFVHNHFGTKLQLRTGILLDYTNSTLYDLEYPESGPKYSLDFNQSTTLSQLYAQLQYKPVPTFKINIGFNSNLYFAGSRFFDAGIEPRFSMNWNFTSDHYLTLSYGMHSQKLPAHLLHTWEEGLGGLDWQLNKNLKTPQSHQVLLAYQWNFAKRWRVKLDFYYQYTRNLAVDSLNPVLSNFHYGSRYDNYYSLQAPQLRTIGQQHKIGGDFSIEKYFGDGYYGIAAFSFVNAETIVNDETTGFTAPNFGAAISPKIILGKEFKIGPIRRNRMTIDLKFVYANDRYIIPVDTLASLDKKRTVYNYSAGFSEQLPHYWRFDLGVTFLFQPKSEEIKHRLSFEILNVFNTKNIWGTAYDRYSNSIQYQYQLPLYFDVMYRVHF